jgi:hypothetical protein
LSFFLLKICLLLNLINLNKSNKEIETFKTNKIGIKIIPIKEYNSAEICKKEIFNDNRGKAGIYL